MKVLVIGANGKIGSILCDKLSQTDGFEPLAMIRKAEQRAKFEKMDVPTVLADLEGSVDDLSNVIKQAEAVVFTAGSGGGSGDDKTLTIDLDGAAKSILAAEQEKVNRYVMISAAYADERSIWPKTGIKPYYVAKHFADKTLKDSSLDYTILRPVRLTDDEATGKLKVVEKPQGLNDEITRSDVAQAVIEVLKNDSTKQKIYEMSEGETEQSSAFS